MAGALDHFSRGLKEDADGAYVDAMRFWSWKILQVQGKKDEARKLAMELVAFHPDSTYTWTLLSKIKDNFKTVELARLFEKAVSDRDRTSYLFAHLMLYTKDGEMKGRLKRIEAMPGAELAPYRSFEKTISSMEVSSSNRQLCKNLEKYFSVGYAEAIARELSLMSDDDRGRKDRSIALAHWGRKYNHYYHALYSSLDLMRQEKLKENLGLMSADSIAHLFPLPFKECVLNAGRDFKIEKNMLYAVMKAESLFYPRAVSSAGAVGLMQLMPQTARGIAGQMKMNKYNLKDPCVSIRFGAHYLAWLKRFFKGNFDLMVAGYNAGAGNVKKWNKTLPVNDEDLYAEFIPFDETRSVSYTHLTLPTKRIV